MKVLSELITILKEFGLPLAYAKFKKETKLPYIIIISTGQTSLGAENISYFSFENYAIELYSDEKDQGLETRLEDHLRKNGIYFQKGEDSWIDTEHMLLVPYYL